jgi:Tfp pilus assembly PilM family ATPase
VIPEDAPGVYMLVDLGLTRTGIYIVRDGYLRFSSTVNLGGNTLTKALARELKLSFDEADKLMQANGLTSDPNDPQSTQIARALMPTISAMQDEVNKHYMYWNTHTDNYGKQRPPIDQITLVGGLANLPGFPEYLEANLKTHVNMANVFVNVNPLEDYIPPIPYNYSLTYAPAIGLALLQS